MLIGYIVWAMCYGIAGPISDQFVRKAYVAAYDRRLRHPAWVRLTTFSYK